MSPVKKDQDQEEQPKRLPLSAEDFNRLLELAGIIHYGSITLQIQDGKVIQIERHEKMRLR